MGEEETRGRAAEEEVRDEGAGEEEDGERRPGVVTDVVNVAEREGEKLQRGPTLPFFAGPLPMRALVAMGIFVAAFLAAWLILWALFGTIGLALGWILAAALGFLAVKAAADRLA